ncbi:unnamed protein product [Caretta caretta]
MGDIDADDLNLQRFPAVNALSAGVSHLPLEMLNNLYAKKLLDLYPNLSIALCLLLSVPITMASGERSFLRLKLLKNYSQDCLNGLSETSVEHEICCKLDISKIIEEFASSKARRVHF